MQEIRAGRVEPLANHGFQDFLIEQGLMVRGSLDPARWVLKPSNSRRDLLEKLWRLVIRTPGYLVPATQITSELYGFSDRDELRAAHNRGRDLREHIEDPNSLYISQVGQGLGIDSLELNTKDALDPVYCLWEDFGKFVHPDILFAKLYSHSQDQVYRDRDTLNARYQRLSERIKFESAVIEAADFDNERYYRLRTLTNEPQPTRLSGTKGVYKKKFQQWLGQIGILSYSKEPRKIELKKRTKIYPSHDKVTALLMERGGRIVPLESIRDIYYNQETVPDNWQKRLTKNLYILRQRCINPDSIFLARGLGWAFGIESLTLSAANLTILNSLWENQNNFVDSKKILEVADKGWIEAAVSEIKKVLLGRPYRIGSRQKEDRLDYILSHEDDLVMPEAA